MGNQLKKEYDVNLDDQCGSGGLGLRWKLYRATDLKSKEEVTIFTFSKKDIPKSLRKESDRYINLLKKSVERGYKLKHPNCLRVIKPIREFRGEIAFVTERVLCSLSNILGDTISHDDNTSHFNLPSSLVNYKFGALQIRSGLAQLCDATLFMHNDAHMVHAFIDPKNIYITECGDWKLFGFEFASHIATENDEAHLDWDFTNNAQLSYYPTFDCLAPEVLISNILTIKSDVFSIGRLSYILHRQQSGIRRETIMKSADEYRRFINDLNIGLSGINGGQQIPFEGIPETLIETLKNTLKTDEKLRCNVEDIVNCKYLNDMIVRVIRYLEKILEKEEEGKIKFLKKLPEVISVFDRVTLIHKVIPPLMIQIKDERMTNYVMPSLMKITEILNCDEYQALIEPVLCRYFISFDLPQVFYLLIDNIVLLCSKSSIESRRDSLVPMILKGLTVRNVAIQTNLLKNVPIIVDKKYIEWKDLKNKMLPKLREICNLSVGQNTRITPLRVNVLMCLAKIFKKFDTETITNIILKECVWKILSKTKETAILMSVLGVADAIAKHVNPQIVANDILPNIIPLLMEPNLKSKQYSTFIKCVRYQIDKIDRFRINQINRSSSTDSSPKCLQDNKTIPSSMHDILEKEFDPQKKGELHKKMDDPFAPSSPTIINKEKNKEIETINKEIENDPFVSLSKNAYDDDLNIGKIGDDKNNFIGFDTQTKAKTTYNAPPIYGTKSAVITAPQHKTESFGWNNDKEHDTLFTNDNNNNNNDVLGIYQQETNNNKFVAKPPPSPPQSSKRRVRAKGSIKPSKASKTSSAFAFMNKSNEKENGNDDMFSGMGIKTDDLFAGLGHKNDKSGFDFMNEKDSKTKEKNLTQSMFQGFGADQSVVTNDNNNNNKRKNNDEDPFAGLF